MTEDSLRLLKQKVAKAVEEYRKDNKSCTFINHTEKSKQSVTSKQEIEQRNAEEKRSQAPSQKSAKQQVNADKEKQSVRSGASSETSSVASKSVYQVEGDDDDEWATLVKFDT